MKKVISFAAVLILVLAVLATGYADTQYKTYEVIVAGNVDGYGKIIIDKDGMRGFIYEPGKSVEENFLPWDNKNGDTYENFINNFDIYVHHISSYYPHYELVSINGKPWQLSELADKIKEGLNWDKKGLLWENGGADVLLQVPEAGKKAVEMYINCRNLITYSQEAAGVEFIDVPPYVKDGTTLVPLRGIVDKFGADLNYDGSKNRVTVKNAGNTIILTVGSRNAVVNGKMVAMEQPAQTVNGRTFIPLRFVSENLGYKVNWNQDFKRIIINN